MIRTDSSTIILQRVPKKPCMPLKLPLKPPLKIPLNAPHSFLALKLPGLSSFQPSTGWPMPYFGISFTGCKVPLHRPPLLASELRVASLRSYSAGRSRRILYSKHHSPTLVVSSSKQRKQRKDHAPVYSGHICRTVGKVGAYKAGGGPA